jgi:hypothetical protein
MPSLAQAKAWDKEARQYERQRDDIALERRLKAAWTFHEHGKWLDAAYSFDRAGRDASFIGQYRIKALCKLKAMRCFLKAYAHVGRGGDIFDITAYDSISDYSDKDEKTWKASLDHDLLNEAAYAAGHATEALDRLGHDQWAGIAATYAYRLFLNARSSPQNNFIRNAIQEYVPNAFKRRSQG